MFTRTNRAEAQIADANEYIHTMEPKLTVGDRANDELHGKRLTKQMLGQLEATLPDTYHIVSISYDCEPRFGGESLGIVLLVPASLEDTGMGMRSHAVADRLTQKAFDKVCGWHPDDGGFLLSTYGVLPDGTLTYDLK